MSARKKRLAAVVGLSAALLVGGSASAWALTGNGPEDIQNCCAHFSGNIYWYPNGQGPGSGGGMDVYGTLTNTEGGNYAKIQGKVEGYSYTELWRTDGSTRGFYGNWTVYDPQATQSDYGWVNVCHHNNFWADDCTSNYNHR